MAGHVETAVGGWACASSGATLVVSDGVSAVAVPNAHGGAVVRSVFLFPAGKAPLLATVGDDKQLNLWRCDGGAAGALSVARVGTYRLPRRPMNVSHARIGAAGAVHSTLVVGDRAGDVYAFSLDAVLAAWPTPASADAADAASALPTRWMLGHTAAMVTAAMPVGGDAPSGARAIVTADREGKLRVSELPAASIIRCFCLGHDSVVTSLLMLDDRTLCSASADGTIRVWDLATGAALQSHRIGGSDGGGDDAASAVVVSALAYDAALGVLAATCDGSSDVLVFKCAAETEGTAPRLRLLHAVDVGGGVHEIAFTAGAANSALLVRVDDSVVALEWDAGAERFSVSGAHALAALLRGALRAPSAKEGAAAAETGEAAAAAAAAMATSRWSSAEFLPKQLATRFDPAANVTNKRKKKRRKRTKE